MNAANHRRPTSISAPLSTLRHMLALALLAAIASCAAGLDGTGADSSSSDASYPDVSLVPGDDADDPAEAAPVWTATEAAAPWPVVDATTITPRDASSPWPTPPEASTTAAPDAGCIAQLGAGSLAIDELMIESVAGTGDYGEWLEVQSASTCAVNLNGLHGECPVGVKLHTFDVTSDVWLLPGATFLVADDADPGINHDLPGPLITWTNQPGDVLRNLGGTVTLTAGGVLVDTITYPSLKPKVGVSIEFPAGCPLSRRSDFTTWQDATVSWFPGFHGTPNAPNTDVACP